MVDDSDMRWRVVPALHHRLVSLQSTDDLERKARLAERRQRILTQEEADLAQRLAQRLPHERDL